MNHHSATQKTISFQLTFRRVSQRSGALLLPAAEGVLAVSIEVERRRGFSIGLFTTSDGGVGGNACTCLIRLTLVALSRQTFFGNVTPSCAKTT